MKKVFIFLFLFTAVGAHAAGEKFLSCGQGYILDSSSKKTDGVNTFECQKLWCRDLETGKSMGSGNTAASGYKADSATVRLCDAENNCAECFGDRKWCSGDPAGIWNPEYGAYTRGGDDNATYISYQKGNCFSWRLEQANCPSGETALLRDGEWVCVKPGETSIGSRGSSIRRTGTFRRIIR
ncbi:MAG: hypothetical protein LBD50_02955 [Rickettsiales bacterium]|jgi:hypothetical protein|nr:hypothetical protein [Rickettsiales bacterium]